MNDFERMTGQLPAALAKPLLEAGGAEPDSVQEIRLRSGGPAMFFDGQRCRPAVDARGREILIDAAQLQAAFLALCGYSLQSHEHELCRGYITTAQGDRIGAAFSASTEGGGVLVRRVNALNLRISREAVGCANEVVKQIDFTRGALIVGAPCSGKTTLLRDIVRALTDGTAGRYKVAVADERCEIATGRSVARCCDVLAGIPKAEAVLMALRTLSPQIIACDEIGSVAEAEGISQGLRAGAAFLATAHSGGRELTGSAVVRRLMNTGAFARILLLRGCRAPTTVERILTSDEYDSEMRGDGGGVCGLDAVRLLQGGGAAKR